VRRVYLIYLAEYAIYMYVLWAAGVCEIVCIRNFLIFFLFIDVGGVVCNAPRLYYFIICAKFGLIGSSD
jgi:hypothetical protein